MDYVLVEFEIQTNTTKHKPVTLNCLIFVCYDVMLKSSLTFSLC